MKQYVYIDDSGDPGLKESSSSHFIIAAILFMDEGKMQLLDDAMLLKLNLANPVITIDGRAGKRYANEIRAYLRQALKENGVERTRIYLTDSRKNSLIQLTDIVAGAVARSYREEKTDRHTYIQALGTKVAAIYELEL